METNGSNSHSHEKFNSGRLKTEVEDKKSAEQGIRNTVFVNHAEITWHEKRKEWVGDQSQKPHRLPRDPVMSWTTAYEDLLLSTEPFEQPIPLAEMVDFLVDIWHEEALYD